MAEYFVGPVMDKLIDAFSEYFKDQVGGKTDVEEELQSLRDNHPKIKAVISAYSQVEIKDPALNKWYWQLRDAIDEADDVLDDFDYWKLERQVIGQNKGKRKAEVPVWNIFENVKCTLRIGKYAPKSDPNLKRLEEAVRKLSKISAEVSTFLHLLDLANQKQQQQQLELHRMREAGSMSGNELLGRSKEMEFVRQWLRKPYQTEKTGTGLYRNISLLSVVGHGGMGKTTLLQHVFQDEVAEEFDVKMLVCVSNNFDAKTVIKNMLESLKKEKTNLDSLGALQSSLRSEVTSKRFLLVLDDIWEEDDGKWENVFAPLQYGSLGSKILITTRLDSVASKFANMIKERKETLPLKGLEEDQCLQLLNTHAFAGVENFDDEFKSIAGKMVEKLLGCPLAAKVIGGILNSYIDKSYWIKVLNTNIGKVGHGQNQLLPILNLSYIYLPNFLQNCFSFCCIFPQDHEFDKNDLVRMWIALGFIESSNIQEETLEDTGRRYFNILVQKSFFDEFCTGEDKVCYKMHDLLHELAQSVYAQECFRIEEYDREFSIPQTARHLSINGINSIQEVAFKKMGEFKNLRSLFLSFYDGDDGNLVSEILKASKSIRLLVINYFPLREMPDTIGIDCLIHLRYLKADGHVELPRCVSPLYHLQFLISSIFWNLEMDKTGWKELMPNKNCQLISDYLRIKDPSATQLTMEPLRSISYFRYLTIGENDKLVSFPTETEQWFLKHSSFLFKLKFEKLQSLQSLPSFLESLSSLNTLEVSNVPQLKLLPNPPASLVTLKLSYLESLQCLSSSSSTFSSLKCLHLTKIPLLKSLTGLPSSLKELRMEELESLQCLPSSMSAISSLGTLKLISIPLLKSLTDLPSSLKELSMEKLESLQCLPSSMSAISSLDTLKLISIPLLKSLTDLPSSLKKLSMEKLESLQCLPSSLLAISFLKTLDLINIPLLKSLPDLPSSLNYLFLKELKSLQCLPSSLSAISSLKNLKLINIPLLKSLSYLPSSLQHLHLQDLKSLQCLPSALSSISSLKILILKNILLLKSLSDLPSSLTSLTLLDLESLQCLSSSLSTFSSLTNLTLKHIPLLKSLPDLPSSLENLNLEALQCLPSSLSTFSSLTVLTLKNIPLLKSLSELPSSLTSLRLVDLESLQCLSSSLSTFSSLTNLELKNIPLLKSLPDLPSSLENLNLESLQCPPSSLSTFSSLNRLKLINIPLLQSLPDLPDLPSSSLTNLELKNIPLLKSLPDLPSSLARLWLLDLESLQCLPSSLSTSSSLVILTLKNIPLLKSLSDLPSSLRYLNLLELENLNCLPSCLPILSQLYINKVPRLLQLPDLPSSVNLSINDCHPQLMERVSSFKRRRLK